jgi:hypothetical protein
VEASGVVPGGNQQCPGDLRSDPAQLPQLGCCLGGQVVQLGVQSGQFGIQGRASLAQQAKGQLGRCGGGQDRARLELRGRAGQLGSG